jgi:hypothetical protein
MEAFQIFRLIFGLIISGFVLYFIINYVATYSVTQEDIVRAQILKAFRDTSRDVWAYGIGTNFSDFGRLSFKINFDIAPINRPVLRTDIGEWDLPVPTLFTFGKLLWIDRSTFDLGWWQFRLTTAQPETVFVFNPTDFQSAEFAIKLVQFLPDTAGKQPKIQYAFCGQDILPMDKMTFTTIDPKTAPTGSCDIKKLKPNWKLIKITENCEKPAIGVCVQLPENGFGQARLAGSEKTYYYLEEWPFGLLALMIGYTNSSIWGIAGDDMYNATNMWFKNEVGLGANVMAKRAQLMATNISGLTTRGLDQNSAAYNCKDYYSELSSLLSLVSSDLSDENWNWQTLANHLADAKAKQAEIEAKC